jgi:small subunit ribosomal protein S6
LRHYELVVILSPMLNQDQAVDTWGRIKGFINNRDGEIFHEETWGTRRLAYSIRKGSHHFLEGTYHLTRFSTETPFNQELETFLRQDEQVLRSMVVVGDPPKPVSETPAVTAPPVVEEVQVPEEPPLVAEEPAVATTDATDNVVEDAPAVAEETPEEATDVVEETVEDAPAVAEETPEEATDVVEETVEDAPAVAEETPEEATDVVEETVEETPTPADETVDDAPEDEPEKT